MMQRSYVLHKRVEKENFFTAASSGKRNHYFNIRYYVFGIDN